jgi:alpha-L-rhamnosidase
MLLSDGWWRGQNHMFRFIDVFGETVGVFAELHVTDDDGLTTVHVTDDAWTWTPSHILRADLIAGEVHDLRRRVHDWCSPSAAARDGWRPVRVADHGVSQLCDTVGPAVRRMGELAAVSVTEPAPGRHIVDFGQVSNGWIRIDDLGPEGTELTIVHAEALLSDGTDVDGVFAGPAATEEGDDHIPFQTDVVISAGDGSSFEPRHSTKGFRYVRIDGHPGPLSPESLTSVVVHNDVPAIGAFSCSDDDLNRLHLAADWSLRTNLCSVPTDCPTRERAGYTGDWQIFVSTAAYLYDVTDFSTKWLHDVAADQRESGVVTSFSPDPGDAARRVLGGWWDVLQGSAGWGDAIVHVPWELYRATGRLDVLRPFVDPMRRWVDFAANEAASRRHADRVAARPTAAPHEEFLWDTGFHFGEWLEPDGVGFDVPRLRSMDHGPTATAFLHRSADELSKIASVVGERQVAVRYAELAQNALAAWRTEFIDDSGSVTPATQAILVRALAFGLVPEEHRTRVAAQLADLIRAADTHLGTGFLATPFLLPVLADNGHLDLAYELLFQRTPPSWLAMLDAGATTVWESWTPFDEHGRVKDSLNHFSMGAVISFLHRYVAGLQLIEPGYRSFKVEPRIGGGLSSASTHHDSPFGPIEVEWTLEADHGRIKVTVPSGTDAELLLPDGVQETLVAGTHDRTWKA